MGETADLVEIVVLTANNETNAARALAAKLLSGDATTISYAAHVTAFLTLTEYIDANYSGAILQAERSLALARRSEDPDAILAALSARILASAGTTWGAADPEGNWFADAWAMRDHLDSMEPNLRMIIGHLFVEGTLSTGRMSEAAELLDGLAEVRTLRPAADAERRPYPPFMQLQPARIAYFQGRINAALPIARAVAVEAERTGNLLWQTLATGYLAVAAAHLGDKVSTRAYVSGMIASFPEPTGYLGASLYAGAGYALFAIGDIQRAAELGELGGGDEDLTRLQVGDRALTFDLLVSAALLRDDLTSAERWGANSLALAAHPAAAPIVQGIVARIDLARGDNASSAEHARVASARARLTGRYLDAARADLIRAKALAASGSVESAVRELTDIAHGAERDGLQTFRANANSELRRLGKRLQPRPGGGWTSLSERERQIAVLAAEGFSNQVIGATLFLSGRTVQSYMSRVLSALDISSRAALPRNVVALRLGSPRDDLPALTPRQWEVATLVADGLSNQELAARLDISVKTAEKHIGEILQRWGVTSRTSIAHLVVTETMRSAG